MWILYAVVGVFVFAALFVWAVRTGQFHDQERARHLPLDRPAEGAPQEQEPTEKDRS